MHATQTEQLNAYLDGEMSPQARAEFEVWLKQSPDARAELDALRKLREQMLEARKGVVPDVDTQWAEFEQRRLQQASQSTGQLILFPRLGAAAAVIFAGLIAWAVWPQSANTDLVADNDASASVEMVESDLEDSSPIVYLDDQSGWIVVWVEEFEANELGEEQS